MDSTDEIIIRNSPLTMDSFYKNLMDMFKCLINVSRPRKNKKKPEEKILNTREIALAILNFMG